MPEPETLMTLETALITGLGAMTSALTYVVGLLWKEMKDWKATCIKLRVRVEELEAKNGETKGHLKAYKLCPKRLECPFFEPPSGK